MRGEICLDVSAAIQQGAGIGRYARRLSEELVRIEEAQGGEQRYQLFYNRHQSAKEVSQSEYLKRLPPGLAELPSRYISAGNREWRVLLQMAYRFRGVAPVNFDKRVFGQATGTEGTGNSQARLFHGLDHICPPFKRAASVITVHDLSFLIFPELHSRGNRLNLKLLLPFCARQADKIIAVSGSTRFDLAQWLGPRIAEKIEVVYSGIDEAFFERPSFEMQQTVLKNYGLEQGQPYILAVGTIEPRKNQARLVEAFASLIQQWPEDKARPKLLLVGKPGWGGEYERILENVRREGLRFAQVEAGLEKGDFEVALLNGVDDLALQVLYSGAAAVAYPTTYEGFGFPALEALASGAPLITANNSAIPEVTGPDGEAALLIDPADPVALTRALKRVLSDLELADHLRKAGPIRAHRFSWEKTARETLAVYERAIKAKVW